MSYLRGGLVRRVCRIAGWLRVKVRSLLVPGAKKALGLGSDFFLWYIYLNRTCQIRYCSILTASM